MTTIYPYNVPPPQRTNTLENVERFLAAFWDSKVVVLGSARVGLHLALQYHGLKRQDHVFVPDYLCQAVLNVLNKTSFPVKYADQRTRAILLFHQWGFPQKMDEVMEEARKRKLLVIEDCAHSFNSRYKGQMVGTFGDAAIFSFPKLFPTYIGGALISSNHDLINYQRDERSKRDDVYNILFNTLASVLTRKTFTTGADPFLLDAVYLKSIHFPNISAGALRSFPNTITRLLGDLDKRRNSYLYIRDHVKGEYINVGLDQHCDVTPFCVPIFLPLSKIEVVQGVLRGSNIIAEILHFDVNRNMFNSSYQKCLAVPCHQNLGKEYLDVLCNILNKV